MIARSPSSRIGAALAAFAALHWLAGCATQPPSPTGDIIARGDPNAPSQVTSSEALAIARSLTAHPWKPFAGNILHGKDRSGVVVNTPDLGYKERDRPGWWIPGEVNLGIPYKWGGFENPAAFDSAIGNGLAAGDVSTPEKRRADSTAVSAQAAGLDCSGFVSRALKLPKDLDTAHIPSVCLPIAPQDLHPGDLLNIARRHVLLCAGWATPDHKWIYYYETGGPPNYWKPGLKQSPIDALVALGYQPLRYKGMTVEAAADGKRVLSRGALSTTELLPQPTIGEP